MVRRIEHAAFGIAMLAIAGTVVANDLQGFARAPALAHAALSPDGASLSYAKQLGARQVIVVRALDRGTEVSTLSLETHRERVRWCDWADLRYVVCGTVAPIRRQHAVRERTRLYAINTSTQQVRELNARIDDVQRDSVIDLLPARSERVLLQHDAVGRGFPEVSELNLVTGALRTLVRSYPPVRSWMTNGRGDVRLGIGYRDDLASLHVPTGADGWTLSVEQKLSDVEAIGPLALGAGATELFALKHHKGRTALFRIDLSNPSSSQLLFADPLYDVAGPVVVHPSTGELLAVRYLAESPAIHFFNAEERDLHAWLDAELPRMVNTVIDRSLDGRRLLVSSESDVEAPSLYLADVVRRQISLVGHQYPQLEGHALSRMQASMYAARDGQRIPSYLTLPAEATPGLLPTVVLPHGGPETRDVRAFNPLVQFLAAQGYAVLQPNFRGSLGYGAGFAAAGAGQWGGVIHNDITDGARWLIARKIADPQRICIVGSSFGGYAALLAATRESEWYACAASFAGVADLLALSQFTQRLGEAAIWQQRIGSDPRALLQMSPLSRVNTVVMPVLMMHGRSDAVVPISQSRRFARALSGNSKPHRFIERADCDHDMSIESCRMAFFETLESFLRSALEDSFQ